MFEKLEAFWRNIFPRPSGGLIAIIDTGILRCHDSFKDTGIPSPPARFDPDNKFNNKVIRQKSFYRLTVEDTLGHGSHVTSLAGGNTVEDAHVNGNAKGKHCGSAPSARLLIYDVTVDNLRAQGCPDAMYEAMQDAIDHDVDVISISMGTPWGGAFALDPIVKGACRAAMKDILVVCAGGNDGPDWNTLYNHHFPFIFCIGASHTYTSFLATVVLGDSTELHGESIFPRGLYPSPQYPLVLFKSIADMVNRAKELKRKIVALYNSDRSQTLLEVSKFVTDHGGHGLIIINNELDGYSINLEDHKLPTINLSYNDGHKLREYVDSSHAESQQPMAALKFLPTEESNHMGMAVAAFSSRGPGGALGKDYIPPGVPVFGLDDDQPFRQQGVLKPDVIAPGVNILGASHLNPKRFVVKSGTSMACPYMAGHAVNLIKANPGWSRSTEVKAAYMSATSIVDKANNPIQDQNKQPAKLYDMGCGHVNVERAKNPGLLYPMDARKVIPAYLRGMGCTNEEISDLVGFIETGTDIIVAPQLNIPSFAIEFDVEYGEKIQKYTRKARNVAKPNSRYKLEVREPAGVTIRVGLVEPPVPEQHIPAVDQEVELHFSGQRQYLEYFVEFELKLEDFPRTGVSEGSITWKSDSGHLVRSPIVVRLIY